MRAGIKVQYSSYDAPKKDSLARFSSEIDAMKFARAQLHSEVSNKSGIIAQFKIGKATEEFLHLDKVD